MCLAERTWKSIQAKSIKETGIITIQAIRNDGSNINFNICGFMFPKLNDGHGIEIGQITLRAVGVREAISIFEKLEEYRICSCPEDENCHNPTPIRRR